MTMLEELRRSGVRHLVIMCESPEPIPLQFKELWAGGFRVFITFIAESADAESRIATWTGEACAGVPANFVGSSVAEVIADVVSRYETAYPEDRLVIRSRDSHGLMHKVDITECDDPERPVRDHYSVVAERDLATVTADELTEQDVIEFFRGGAASWRPFAAGLPWIPNPSWVSTLLRQLKRLDNVGPDENRIAYIVSESGAGGTTLSRFLAWSCAKEGYIVLAAKQVPFLPDALPIVNYLNRVHAAISHQRPQFGGENVRDEREPASRLYQVPCLIVFDTLHWQYREDELIRFSNELVKSGRPACILVVTGPLLSDSMLNSKDWLEIAELTHAITLHDTLQLGEHLNRFLRRFGKQRDSRQWQQFYADHTVQNNEGLAAFWVTLSFWMQGQYDLSESIQEWMYRCFKQNVIDDRTRMAILRIAALTTERLPLPEVLLPASSGEWPTSQVLVDIRPKLASCSSKQSRPHSILVVVTDFEGRT